MLVSMTRDIFMQIVDQTASFELTTLNVRYTNCTAEVTLLHT